MNDSHAHRYRHRVLNVTTPQPQLAGWGASLTGHYCFEGHACIYVCSISNHAQVSTRSCLGLYWYKHHHDAAFQFFRTQDHLIMHHARRVA